MKRVNFYQGKLFIPPEVYFLSVLYLVYYSFVPATQEKVCMNE